MKKILYVILLIFISVSFIRAAIPCTGTPSVSALVNAPDSICPFTNYTLRCSPITDSNIVFLWESSLDSIKWTSLGFDSTYLLRTSIYQTKYYRLKVTCLNSGLFAYSPIKMISTKNCGVNYCNSSALQTNDEDIFNVKIGKLDNTSDCLVPGGGNSILQKYGDYTNDSNVLIPILGKSNAYNLSATIGSCSGSSFNTGLAVFIDYNNDGKFTDAGEKVYSSPGLFGTVPSTILKIPVTIPANAVKGITRMRLIAVEGLSGSAISPCLNYNWGETEDYSVSIDNYIPPTPCDTMNVFLYTVNGNTVNFIPKNAPKGYIVNYFWTFSNGQTSNLKSPSINFSNGLNWGKLIVCITDTNLKWICCDSSKMSFTTNSANSFTCQSVKAKFGYSQNAASIQFTDSSSVPSVLGLTYEWNFGNGIISKNKNPYYTYPDTGTFKVILKITAWYNNGIIACTDTISKNIKISLNNICSKLIPIISFNQSQKTFNFSDLTSYKMMKRINTVWDFGDGTTSTISNPTKTYLNIGSYIVNLNITVYDSATASICSKSISQVVISSLLNCQKRTSRFLYTKNNLQISFFNTFFGNSPQPGDYWKFGNGDTSSVINPIYTYPNPGLYKVVLYIKTPSPFGGFCYDSIAQMINVNTSNPCKDSGYISSNISCSNYINPVCGCDSITYQNYCYAQKAGVKQFSFGSCYKDTNFIKISGYVVLDNNYNCIKDPLENGLEGIFVSLTNGTNTISTTTNSFGYYQFYAKKGNYTIKQDFSSSAYYQNNLKIKQYCPSNNASINLNAISGVYPNNNFYDTVENCLNLGLFISKYRNATPGFTRDLYLNYANYSPFLVTNAVVKYKKNNVQTYLSSNIIPNSISGNDYTWNLSPIQANKGGSIIIKLLTTTTTAIGTSLNDSAWIEPINIDCNKTNNFNALNSTVVSSFDPNDKSVSPEGETDKGNITKDIKSLDYQIRFQNTGTSPAFNVRIEDQLDKFLDWKSIRMNGASHFYQVFMDDAGKIIFEFRDIMLPDSTTDSEGSKGFINFSIDIMENIKTDSIIKNQAYIYFDFNEAIITNTVINTIIEKSFSSVNTNKNVAQIQLTPNPANDLATLIIQSKQSEKTKCMFYDINGRIVKEFYLNIQEGIQSYPIDIKDLYSGIYTIQLSTNSSIYKSMRLVKE